jgi:hypothetical protein
MPHRVWFVVVALRSLVTAAGDSQSLDWFGNSSVWHTRRSTTTAPPGTERFSSSCFPAFSYRPPGLFVEDDAWESSANKRFHEVDHRFSFPRLFTANAGLLWLHNGRWSSVLARDGEAPPLMALAVTVRNSRWGPSALRLYLLQPVGRSWCLSNGSTPLNLLPPPRRTTTCALTSLDRWTGLQDPRLFPLRGAAELGMSYTNLSCTSGNRTVSAHHPVSYSPRSGVQHNNVGVTVLGLSSSRTSLVKRRRSVRPAALGRDVAYSKNWGYFPCPEAPDGACVLFNVQPLQVYALPRLDGDHVALVNETWDHPRLAALNITLRGGAPPVQIGDTLYVFVHSHPSYFVYLVTLDAKTYKLKGYTLFGFAFFDTVQVFVCGAVFDTRLNEWTLSMGVDDADTALVQLRHQDVVDAVVPHDPK